MSRRWLLLAMLVGTLPSLVFGQPAPNAPLGVAPSIVGTWSVVAVETIRPNGEALTDWLGPHPTGTIVYLPSGYVAVQIMADPRPTIAGRSYRSTTREEKIAAIDGYYAYYGKYEVDAQSKMVVHNIQASLRPNEVGISYQRHFEVTGDRLILTTVPSLQSGEMRYNRLTWERLK